MNTDPGPARAVQIQIVGLANGRPSPIAGQWLVEYDPTRTGHTPDGRPMTAHIVCSADRRQARRFGTVAEAHACWNTTSGRYRPDKQVDRPLTAFNILVVPVEDQ